MDCYGLNIKNYAYSTRHLTLEQDAIYRRLIELYFVTERPLVPDWFRLTQLIGLDVEADRDETVVQAVLDEFFVLTGEGYRNDDIDELIDLYRGSSFYSEFLNDVGAFGYVASSS